MRNNSIFNLKFILYAVSTVVLLIIMIIFLGGIWFLRDFDKGQFDKIFEHQTFPPSVEQNISVIEAESFISSKELNSYLLFSENPQFNVEPIDNKKDLIFFKDEVSLPNLGKNDCEEFFCYQHRIKFDHLPPGFWKGLIGIEDFRFLNHSGIDFKSILRAIYEDIKNMGLVQGGSTLTQQLVKNLFLSNEKTISRKVKEIFLAYYLEYNYSKEKIIEAYINEFEWGRLQKIKVKGIYSAAIFYFDKNLTDLTSYEVAILIGLLKGPYHYHPIHHLDRTMSRAKIVYNRLIELNFYPKKEQEEWDELKFKKWALHLKKKEDEGLYHSLVISKESKGELLSPYESFVFNHKVFEILRKMGEKTKEIKPDFALKAKFKNLGQKNTFEFYSKIERSLYKGLNEEKHQIGSTIKPLIYGILMDKGYSWDQEVSLSPISIKYRKTVWRPKEPYRKYPESTTLSEALLKSYNRPIVRLVEEVGFDEIEKDLLHFIPDLKTPLAEFPSQLLGSIEMSISDSLSLLEKFINKECSRSKDTPNVISILSDPKKSTIAKNIGPYLSDHHFFGKTGTTNLGMDNWFIFFDGKILGVLWFGPEGERTNTDRHFSGASTSFQVFQSFYRERGKRFNELKCHF